MLLTVFKNYFFNMMNNSAYGKKKIENLRKRVNIRLVNDVKYYKKYVSKPSFVAQKLNS